MSSRALVPVLLIALSLPGTVIAQEKRVDVDVGSMQPGQEPPGFTFSRTGSGDPAQWRVLDDPTATKQKAIAQTSKDTTENRFPLAVYQPVSAKNVDVTIRFKPVSGKVDEAGGIAVRLTTPDDYYVARANVLEDNVNFYRVVKGRRSQIKGVRTKVAPNGTRSGCAPKRTSSRSRSTVSRFSPPRTRHSPTQERPRCGPRGQRDAFRRDHDHGAGLSRLMLAAINLAERRSRVRRA
jgi:hypothetical protein